MEAYIYLIAFVFIFRIICHIIQEQKALRHNYFLSGVFFYLYIFCVIRSFEVGIDIPGYISVYNETANISWNDWDYSNFENGYIFLMKICNMIGLSARGFFCVVYALIFIPVYALINRESKDPLLSVIVFICFQFFVFDLTGLRQSIAMSICMIAFMVALKHSKYSLIMFIVLVYAASMIHRSALTFIIVYQIIRFPIKIKYLIIFAIGAIVCSIANKAGVTVILEYYNSLYGWSNDESSQLGLSLVMILMFGILGFISYRKQVLPNSLKVCQASTNMVLTSVCIMFLGNGSVLLRTAMYFYFPIIILLPVITKSFGGGFDKIAKYAIIIMFLTHFFFNELNSFNVTPYEIANNLSLTK